MLNEAGSVASIISLLVTVWIAFEIRGLHHFYKRHLLLPKSIEKLSRLAKSARAALGKKQTDEIKGLLRISDAVLERVPKYADKTLQLRVQSTRQLIASIVSDSNLILTRGYDAVEQIEALVQSAKDFTGDDKWSTRT